MLGAVKSEPPSLPDSTRQAILSAAIGTDASLGGVLFEPADFPGRPYRPTLFSSGPPAFQGTLEIRSDSLLTRWLRVNDSVLEIPDAAGVFGALASSDRQILQTLDACICLPLVHDGELTAWIAFSGSAGRFKEDRPGAILRAHRWAESLHEAKAVAARLERAQSASRSNRLNIAGQLAATVAHEVRNPLAAIRSMVQLVKDADAPPAEHHRLLTTVIDEVDRVNAILTGMLTLGRPHQSNHELCSLAEISRQATGFCEAYARRHGQRLAIIASDPLWLLCDPFELRQVLVNLILNACQASRSEAGISVEAVKSLEADGSWATIRITDSGTGIAAQNLSRVFDAFYTTKRDGAGLGLGICREIVQRHRGRIVIQSEIGSGTVVQVQLPLSDAHAPNSGC